MLQPVFNDRRVLTIWLCVALISGLAFTDSIAQPTSGNQSSSDKVSVEGGVDVSGNVYTWKVTNRHDSPIVEVWFMHFRANAFNAPDGWEKETEYLVNVGVPDKPGECKATVDRQRMGIQPGESAEFGVNIDARGASVGHGQFHIGFADGTAVVVDGVEMPRPENFFEKFATPIGMALLVGIALLINKLRNRKQPLPAGEQGAGPGETPTSGP